MGGAVSALSALLGGERGLGERPVLVLGRPAPPGRRVPVRHHHARGVHDVRVGVAVEALPEPGRPRRDQPDPQRPALPRRRALRRATPRPRRAPRCSRAARATTSRTGPSSATTGSARSRRSRPSSRRSRSRSCRSSRTRTSSLEGHGVNSGYRLLTAYSRLIENLFLVYQYHFEMLPLGYFAQINLREFCLQAFPGISEQAISDLTAGVELMQFRPDEELKRLATRAVELGIGRQVRTSEDPEATLAELARPPGRGASGSPSSSRRATPGSASRWGPASSTTSGHGRTTCRSRGPRSRATSRASTAARRSRARARSSWSAATA